MSDDLRELGRLVAAESEASADPELLAAAKRRAIEAWADRRRQAPPASIRLASAAGIAGIAGIALIVVLLALGSRRAAALAFTVAGAPAPVGAWIAAGEAHVPIAFSEGTTVVARPGTRVRVTGATEGGAALSLERGALDVRVAHRGADPRWFFYAGPFTVKVVGTAFLLSWDSTAEALTLEMLEGSVSVSGPLLEQGRSVRRGEKLHVRHREKHLSLVRGAPAAAEPPAAFPPSADPEPSADSEPEPPHAARAPAVRAPGPAWQSLARASRHEEAMAAVERAGFESVVESVSDADLLLLADLARYAGRHGRAHAALLAARRRGTRGTTAFLLGRLASDHLGAPAEALRWFRTYVAEEPRGVLREQALGRILELTRRSGDGEAARGAARAYLEEFPDGTYASTARSALDP